MVVINFFINEVACFLHVGLISFTLQQVVFNVATNLHIQINSGGKKGGKICLNLTKVST